MRAFQWFQRAFVLALAAIAVPASADQALRVGMAQTPNVKPTFLGEIHTTCYDGVTDDLLTAGLGKTGLAGAAPGFINPLAPTPAELRRRAIYTNYRAVLDITAAGGYGTVYGPNVDTNGNDTASEGKIAGCEHIAYADDGSGKKNVTLMVQVPTTFDSTHPCIITAHSSGSRGVYGAIGASGEWGLKHGCAVAYNDKGTGNGLHDLETNVVGLIDGTHTTANVAGTNTQQSIVFAFYALNEQFGVPAPNGFKRIVFDRRNMLVIASGISNGGTGALAAAEQDRFGLIDGVAITEPNAQPRNVDSLRIQQGATVIPTIGKPLYDYFTFANLYQPCAALAVGASAPGFAFLSIPNASLRCSGLRAKGLVSGDTLPEQASDALARLNAYGWLPDSDVLQATHYRFATNAIAVTYSNAYGRFSVADNVCGFSFANTDASGNVAPQNLALQASIFATGNGVPPTTGVNIVYNDSLGGAKLDLLAVSPSTGNADFALDGAICHRNLVEGRDIITGAALTGATKATSDRVREGIEAVKLTSFLKNTPAIVVHGRSDALVPVNHSSRAYYANNQATARGASQLRYIEVTNAQHFDAFL